MQNNRKWSDLAWEKCLQNTMHEVGVWLSTGINFPTLGGASVAAMRFMRITGKRWDKCGKCKQTTINKLGFCLLNEIVFSASKAFQFQLQNLTQITWKRRDICEIVYRALLEFQVWLPYGSILVVWWRLYIYQHQRCYLKAANINVKKLTSLNTMLRMIKSYIIIRKFQIC
jgi:hypothetical protein